MESKRDQHNNSNRQAAAKTTTGKGGTGNGPSENSSFYSALALVGQVGFYIALPMVFGALFGQFLDHTITQHVAPLATIFGLLLGLAAGVSLVVRLINRLPQ